mgnify:CR=1 FL=1
METNQNIEISSELQDNTIIWRYLTLEKFFSLILNRELYFGKIRDLDDKFEGTRPPKFRFINSVAFLGGHSPKYKKARKVYEKKQMEMIQLQKDAYNTLVNCWSMEIPESYALWDIYTGTSSGIAIKSTIGQLKRAIEGKSHLIHITPVDYKSNEIKKFNLDTLVTWKTSFYKFEKEVRLYISHSDLDFILIPVNIEELISEIYLSPFMPTFAKDTVRKMIKLDSKTTILPDRIKDSAIELRL